MPGRTEAKVSDMARAKKIVIADDNREMCDLVQDIFSENGYEVDCVHNGYELMSYLENNSPSVIILDLMMPEKDGISVLGSLKQLSPYSRIIIYTGYQEYEKSVYARAVDRFLVKGKSIEELIEAVDELAVA
ncbi:MAG: response regulator [Candidatus Omnitrophica bacterium]|nr:response regulator [Candidatus Omnitrophota bacterium]